MKLKIPIVVATVLSLLTVTVARSQQWGDYTLYGTMNGSTTYLVDTNGTNYHTWSHSSSERTGYSTYMLPGGTLVRTVDYPGAVLSGGGMTGQVQKVDWNGNVLWNFIYSSSAYCLHHDICPMPNGNVLMISYEVKTATQATQAGSSLAITIWPDKIIEVEPTGATTGNIVWEWHAWDHLVQNHDSTKDNYYPTIIDHPELLNINYQTQKDWLHMNGLDYNAQLDQIAFSSHALDEMYVIDHSTTTAEAAGHTGGKSGRGGDILYRWGNPEAYDATGLNTFHVIHDAHWIPQDCPKANWLVGYNNNGISSIQSCVDMIYPPYNGYVYDHVPGQAYAPSTYDFRYACNGHNNNMGNSQQLPNGNMLVCIAQSGTIYEVDSNGTVLWTKNASGSVPQAFRYSVCYVDGTLPATPVITLSNDTLYASTAGTTYTWYLNGVIIAGATDQYYSPLQNGTYEVQVADAGGCKSLISVPFLFLTSGISDNPLRKKTDLYPNPTNGLIYLNYQSIPGGEYEIVVSDALGKTILTKKNSWIIDLSSFDDGVYYLSIKSGGTNFSDNKVILIR